jgi:hypothetical protein
MHDAGRTVRRLLCAGALAFVAFGATAITNRPAVAAVSCDNPGQPACPAILRVVPSALDAVPDSAVTVTLTGVSLDNVISAQLLPGGVALALSDHTSTSVGVTIPAGVLQASMYRIELGLLTSEVQKTLDPFFSVAMSGAGDPAAGGAPPASLAPAPAAAATQQPAAPATADPASAVVATVPAASSPSALSSGLVLVAAGVIAGLVIAIIVALRIGLMGRLIDRRTRRRWESGKAERRAPRPVMRSGAASLNVVRHPVRVPRKIGTITRAPATLAPAVDAYAAAIDADLAAAQDRAGR